MNIMDCKVGDVVRVWCYNDDNAILQTEDFFPAIIAQCYSVDVELVVEDKTDVRCPFLFAARKGLAKYNPNFTSVSSYYSLLAGLSAAGLNPDDYQCGGWINSVWYLTPGSSASSVSSKHTDGMTCVGRHCHTFNEFAIANQPDGTFLCYQCRQRPSFMRTA